VSARGFRSIGRIGVVVLSLLALVGLPAGVLARVPARATDRIAEFVCDTLTNTAGTAILAARVSSLEGADAFVAFWPVGSDPFIDPPALERDFDAQATVAFDGTSLSGEVPLLPAGAAIFAATAVATSDPVPFDERFRDGNRLFRAKGTITPLAIEGSLTLPGAGTFDLGGCVGSLTNVSMFGTNPNAFVRRFSQRSVACELDLGDGTFASVFMFFEVDSVFIEAALIHADGSGVVMAGGVPEVSGAVSGPLEAMEAGTGEPLEPGSVDATVRSSGEAFQYTLKNGVGTRRVSGVLLDVSGSLTFPGEAAVDISSCVGVDSQTKEVVTAPHGPKPGGKVPRNDKPAGAITLAPGGRSTIATRGASPEMEADYACLDFIDPDTGEVFPFPARHTVWYRIAGTGHPVTVDSAGSNFDTVMAAYRKNAAGAFVPVADACIDDVPLQPVGATLQAAVTFPTAVGTTYWVQVGGFPDEMPYGTLKIKVR
jgi:hypothetical protein